MFSVGTDTLHTHRPTPAVSTIIPVAHLAWDAPSLELSFERSSFQVFSQPQNTHACMISESMKSTMKGLLAVVLPPNNPSFHSVQADWRIQTLVLPHRKQFILGVVLFPARILLPIPPPEHVPLWDAPWYDCLLRFCPERTHSFTRCRLTGVIQTMHNGPPEPKIIYSTSPGPGLPTDATPRTRSVLGGPSPRRACIYAYSFYHGTLGTLTVYFKVLGRQCHWSMYYCCCIPEIYVVVPKICRPIL